MKIFYSLFVAIVSLTLISSTLFGRCPEEILTLKPDPYRPLSPEEVEKLYRKMKRRNSYFAAQTLGLSFVPLLKQAIIRRLGPNDPDIDDLVQILFHKVLVKAIVRFEEEKLPGGETIKDKMMIYLSRWMPFLVNRKIGPFLKKRNLYRPIETQLEDGEVNPYGMVDLKQRHFDNHGAVRTEELENARAEIEKIFKKYLKKLRKYQKESVIKAKIDIFKKRWLGTYTQQEIADIHGTSRANIGMMENLLRADFLKYLEKSLGPDEITQLHEIIERSSERDF